MGGFSVAPPEGLSSAHFFPKLRRRHPDDLLERFGKVKHIAEFSLLGQLLEPIVPLVKRRTRPLDALTFLVLPR